MMMSTAVAPQARVVGGRCPAIPEGTLVRVVEVHPATVAGRTGAVTAVLPSGRRVVLSQAAIEYLP